MLIKEYRILLPLNVEEFRIGLLYMLLKKSRMESHGDGNGIEILKNEPYSGEEGTGQYTLKILHVGSHIPKWFMDMAPEDAFKLQEESWNLYPYVHTISTSPFTDKYRLELKSKFVQDKGKSENIFNLTPSELRSRQVVYLDITNTAGDEVKPGEDPSVFRSQKTGRGPLTSNWMDQPDIPVMCCYKLAKVELRYWGLQSRAEQLIHEMGIQKTFRQVHRQVWCWIDEWFDLKISDIRRLEEETASLLTKLMSGELDSMPSITLQPVGANGSATEQAHSVTLVSSTEPRSKPRSSVRRHSQAYILETLHDSDDEFYDAVDVTKPSINVELEDSSQLHPGSLGLLRFESSFDHSDDDSNQDAERWSTRSVYWDTEPAPAELVFHSGQEFVSDRGNTSLLLVVHGGSYLDTGADASIKQCDFKIFSSKLDELRQKHFYQTQHQVLTRLVACPSVCTRALACLGVLKSCPGLSQNSLGTGLSFHLQMNSTDVEDKLSNFSLGAIPLLVRTDKRYVEHLTAVINAMNSTYEEFISSTEDFSGQISIVSDCMGSLLTYDILTQFSSHAPLLKFRPHQLFMLGSPVGMILAQEKLMGPGEQEPLAAPGCEHLYNIYYEGDPLSFRIEPLLDLQTRFLSPVRIHRYNKLPLGDGSSLLLQDYLNEESGGRDKGRSQSVMDTFHTATQGATAGKMNRLISVSSCEGLMARWWGAERVDFAVQSPNAVGKEGFQNFTAARILYSRYWEANEILSFILRSCVSYSEQRQTSLPNIATSSSFFQTCERMELTRFRSTSSDSISAKNILRKRNNIKSFSLTKNFRGIDTVVREGQTQVIQGKFSFGKLDLASLSREKIEIFYQDHIKGWSVFDIATTDTHGVLNYVVPTEKQFSVGVHDIHMLSGDTSTVVQLAVLPASQTVDAVLFSIDGSFYRDFSVKGNKSKVRTGSVEIIEFWKNLGYLVFYMTARPDMQKNDIMHWFDKKNFPSGLTYFNEGVKTDPQTHKSAYIRHLIQDLGVRVCAAYGSPKEVQIYRDAGVQQSCIYSVSKKSKASDTNHPIGESFLTHIQELSTKPPPLAKTSVLLATHK